MKALLCLSLALLPALVLTDEAGTGSNNAYARVLVSKHIQNKYLVEGKDIVVKYGLYNVGESAAVDVVVNERGFAQSTDFEVVGGMAGMRVQRLAPGANASHTLVVRPRRFGYFNFTAAEVNYRVNDDPDAPAQVGFSSDPGQGLIISLKDYDRQFSAHMLDWLAFAVMTLPSLGIPFLLWTSSKSKYEALARSKKD